MLDLAGALCYIVCYLSHERFLFARLFAETEVFCMQYREAMLTNP